MSGRVIVMGSGELAPGLVATHRAGLEAAKTDRVVVLDTPYGFQENADQLTERIATFFETSLRATVEIASLRTQKADDVTRERFLATIRNGRYVFSGPGSPSYALRIWNEIGLVPLLQGVVLDGGTVSFASAASLTLGRTTLPVYEIYKVGEAPSWLPGLDLLSSLGFPCTVVPHWNNAEGGNHDTSRCYVGERRFRHLTRSLDVGVLGVDEHTAATIDFGANLLSVTGVGSVTLRGDSEMILPKVSALPANEALLALGDSAGSDISIGADRPVAVDLEAAIAQRNPDAVLAALLTGEAASQASEGARSAFRSMLVRVVDEAKGGLVDPRDRIEGFVTLLLKLRASARDNGDYTTADAIRNGLTSLGIEVRDAPGGSTWEPRES
jgi:cyanophycinase-like exopeptidase